MHNNNLVIKFLFFLIGQIFICSGCSQPTGPGSSKNIFFVPLEPVVLEGKLFGPINYFQQPTGCQILRDSLLLVVDNKTEKLLSIVSLNSGKLISEYGIKGPNGMQLDEVAIRPPFFVDSCKNFVDLLEPSKRRFSSFNIDSLIKGSNSYFPGDFITTPPEIGSPLELVRVNDSVYIGNTASPCERLFKWNLKSGQITCSPILVPHDSRFKPAQEAQFNYDVITVKPDNKLIIAAMYYYNRIDVYDLMLNHKFSVLGQQNNFPHDLCQSINGEMKCNWDELERHFGPALYATDNYFYVMSKEPLKSHPKTLNDYQCVVYKFNWSGELEAMMELGIYTTSFAVSESRKKIYAVDFLNNSNQLLLAFQM